MNVNQNPTKIHFWTQELLQIVQTYSKIISQWKTLFSKMLWTAKKSRGYSVVKNVYPKLQSQNPNPGNSFLFRLFKLSIWRKIHEKRVKYFLDTSVKNIWQIDHTK